MVERLVRDQEVGCSNHLTPTRKITDGFAVCYFFARSGVLRQRHRESPQGRMLASRLTKTRAILGQKPRSGFCWSDENHLTPTRLSLVNVRLQGFCYFCNFRMTTYLTIDRNFGDSPFGEPPFSLFMQRNYCAFIARISSASFTSHSVSVSAYTHRAVRFPSTFGAYRPSHRRLPQCPALQVFRRIAG